jgi:3-oxoadipate enol-lactonase
MQINDLDISFNDSGKGLPIVLLHGLTLDKNIWSPMVAAYSAQARFITPDLRGHGATTVGKADGTLSQVADDLLALMDALSLPKVCLLGHSMGGYIALNFATRYPQRLASLVLLASNIRADAPEKQKSRLEDAQKVLHGGVPAFAAALASRITTDPFLTDQLQTQMETIDPAGLSNILIAIANRPDQRALLPKLELPVLAIAGTEDKIATPALGLEAADLAARGHKLVIPGVGHMPMLENPLTLGAALLSFQEYCHESQA